MSHFPLIRDRHPMLPGEDRVEIVCANCNETWPCEFSKLRDELSRITDRVNHVMSLHQEYQGHDGTVCCICVANWPCKTRRILDGHDV